jgi:transposase
LFGVGVAERTGGQEGDSRIARRGIESSQRLGRHRFVVERSLAWLVGYRRLQVRYERRADVLLGFLYLACALICLKSPNRWPVGP